MDRESAVVVMHTKTDEEIKFTEETTKTELSSTGKHHVFRIPLTAESRIISYSCQLKNGGMSEKYNVMCPQAVADKLSFIVYGDSQAKDGARQGKVTANFQALKPCFILRTGDISSGKGSDAPDIFGTDWSVNFFNAVPRQVLATIPYYVTEGNHDNESPEQMKAYSTVFPQFNDSGNYSFRWGNALVISLDIESKISEFVKNNDEAWLKKEIGKYPDATWKIAFFHVPPWSGGKHGESEWAVGGREKLLGVLMENGIDIVFSGHEHNYERLKPISLKGVNGNPVQFVITGCAGANYYDAKEQPFLSKLINKKDHFCSVNVSGEVLSVEVFDSEKNLLDKFEIRKDKGKNTFGAEIFEVEQKDK